MIHETNTRMLTLLSEVLHGSIPEKLPKGEWPALFREMREHFVYALPAEQAAVFGLTEKEAGEYLLAIVRNRQRFYTLMQEQEKLLAALEAKNIRAVVLKGAAAAMSYVRPENRCMGDIDLLVQPQDFDAAYTALAAAGCSGEKTTSGYLRHVNLETENGIEVELHRFFSSSDHAGQNSLFDELLYQAIPNCIKKEVCGFSVSVLPPLENGLVLLGHINHHLSGGLGLRQIIDWMEYVESYLDDAFWESGFAELAEKLGMRRLAILTTAMCRKYLGLQKDIHWCEYEPICDELMEYVLAQGNFGRKTEPNKARTTAVLKEFRNPLQGLKTAQSYGLRSWKACRKHPVLRPFAWCYQLCRWISHGLRAHVSTRLLSEASVQAKERIRFMKRLGVTRL